MTDFLDIAKGALGVVAPTLARAVGGPLAGQAVQAICGALGLAPDTPPDQLSAAMQNATPEQLAAIRKADNDFKVAMRSLDVTEAQLAYSDIASARDREKTVKDHVPAAMGFAIVGAFIAAVFMLLGGWGHIESAMAGALMGYLSAKAEQVVSYYFGSAKGMQDQSKMLWQSVPK